MKPKPGSRRGIHREQDNVKGRSRFGTKLSLKCGPSAILFASWCVFVLVRYGFVPCFPSVWSGRLALLEIMALDVAFWCLCFQVSGTDVFEVLGNKRKGQAAWLEDGARRVQWRLTYNWDAVHCVGSRLWVRPLVWALSVPVLACGCNVCSSLLSSTAYGRSKGAFWGTRPVKPLIIEELFACALCRRGLSWYCGWVPAVWVSRLVPCVSHLLSQMHIFMNPWAMFGFVQPMGVTHRPESAMLLQVRQGTRRRSRSTPPRTDTVFLMSCLTVRGFTCCVPSSTRAVTPFWGMNYLRSPTWSISKWYCRTENNKKEAATWPCLSIGPPGGRGRVCNSGTSAKYVWPCGDFWQAKPFVAQHTDTFYWQDLRRSQEEIDGVVTRSRWELCMVYDLDVRGLAMDLVRMKGFFSADSMKYVRDDREYRTHHLALSENQSGNASASPCRYGAGKSGAANLNSHRNGWHRSGLWWTRSSNCRKRCAVRWRIVQLILDSFWDPKSAPSPLRARNPVSSAKWDPLPVSPWCRRGAQGRSRGTSLVRPARPPVEAHDKKCGSCAARLSAVSSLSTLPHVKKCGKLRRTARACTRRSNDNTNSKVHEREHGQCKGWRTGWRNILLDHEVVCGTAHTILPQVQGVTRRPEVLHHVAGRAVLSLRSSAWMRGLRSPSCRLQDPTQAECWHVQSKAPTKWREKDEGKSIVVSWQRSEFGCHQTGLELLLTTLFLSCLGSHFSSFGFVRIGNGEFAPTVGIFGGVRFRTRSNLSCSK